MANPVHDPLKPPRAEPCRLCAGTGEVFNNNFLAYIFGTVFTPCPACAARKELGR